MSRRFLIALPAAAALWFLAGQASAASCDISGVRWASSSNRIYVSGADTTCTLPEIDALLPKANLTPVAGSDGAWWLGSNIFLEGGATLAIHGPAVSQLRLKSNNTGTNPTVLLRADNGTIDINGTTITSWDDAVGGPDTNYGNGRSYIQVKSRLVSGTARESRMNIANSDIGYLGYNASESYGLSWKVLGSGAGLFDTVNVYGDITNSRIHHNYFGVYSYGLEGGTWTGNQIDNNVVYGLDPHDDSDNLVITNNETHHNGSHGIICSQRCNNLTIRDNSSHHNSGNGIMLHRNTNDSVVENNTVSSNGDAGLAIFDSHRNVIQGNQSVGNKHGIRFSVGSAENVISDNLFQNSLSYGIYFYKGSDAPTAGDGRPKENVFENNEISGSVSYALSLKQADDNRFVNNSFTDNHNAAAVYMEDAHRSIFVGNTMSGSGQEYYYAKKTADATIQDTKSVKVKLGDSVSFVKLQNSSQQVFANTRGVATTLTPTEASLTATRALSTGVMQFFLADVIALPDAGSISVLLNSDYELGDEEFSWQAKAESGAPNLTYTVRGLDAEDDYTIDRDGSTLTTVTADGNGTVTFVDSLTDTLTHQYTLDS